jgi:hypothetical protein
MNVEPDHSDDFLSDAIANAKFAFLAGCAIGVQSSFNAHKREAILFDIVTFPGTTSRVFRTGVSHCDCLVLLHNSLQALFSVGALAFTTTKHLAKELRGENDNINDTIGFAVLGAISGLATRKMGKVVLHSAVIGALGGFLTYAWRQTATAREKKIGFLPDTVNQVSSDHSAKSDHH